MTLLPTTVRPHPATTNFVIFVATEVRVVVSSSIQHGKQIGDTNAVNINKIQELT